MKKGLLLVTLSVCLLPLWAQRDFSEIDSLIKKMLPEASEVGISVYDLTAKKPLYNYRAEKLSRPASTMKLLTAITALSRPDANEPFRTEVWHDGVIEHDTLQGNLYVVGGFDPEFDSQAMDSLIAEVITFPFSVINGQVYGDVSMKDSLYWGMDGRGTIPLRAISLICPRSCSAKERCRFPLFPPPFRGIRQAFPASLYRLITPWPTGQRHALLLPESSLSQETG